MPQTSRHALREVTRAGKDPAITPSAPVYVGLVSDDGFPRHVYRLNGEYIELPVIAGGSIDEPVPADNLPLLLRSEQAIAQLQCSRAHFFRIVKSGELESVFIGKDRRGRRIPRQALIAYVEKLRARSAAAAS